MTQPVRPSAFANLLTCHRLALHLTQEALAERAGVSARAISDLERGVNQRPHADTLQRLMEGLALSEPDRATLQATARRQTEHAFCLLAGCHAPPPVEGAANFIGRATELALLRRHMRSQGPPLLLLEGPPGIGASRLLEVTAAGAGGFGLRVLTGTCHQFGDDALEPVLRTLAIYARAQSPAQLRRDLRGCERMLLLLPQLAEAYAEPLPPVADASEQMRRLTHDAIARFLANIGGPAGTLLMLHDLQWATQDALHLLAALVRTQPSPLRVVASCSGMAKDGALARFAGDLARSGLAARHVLPPLSADESWRLITLRLGSLAAAPAPELRQRILQCQGVPAALVQLATELSGAAPGADGAPPPTAPDAPPWSFTVFDARLGIAPSASALVGRESDAATIAALLRQEDARLVTLTGPGGVGKTRLAARVAAEAGDLAPDRLYCVPLASLPEASLVPMALAQALGVRERAHVPLVELISRRLFGQRALLVLDNFEHVLGAVGFVAQLLAASPQLKVLVTSRAALHIPGEREYAVAPLACPGPDVPATPAVLARYAAVDLFVRRAALVKTDFQLTGANAPAVAAICARLDGLPLAIELAAARVALLPPVTLLARLTTAAGNPSLGMLTGGARDAPERLQTMRTAIAWSHQLLSPAAQQAFRRLAVCAGGCTVPAAESLCQLGDATLNALTELTDHSLVRTLEEQHGEVRLTMLATIHSFAKECLLASGEADEMRRRHAEHYVTVAEVPEAEYVGPQQLRYLARWQREQENLRAALQWSLDAEETALGLRLAAALWDHWICTGQLSEGRGWLEILLARDDASAGRRARALNGAGLIAWHLGDYQQAEKRIRESVALYRADGDLPGECRALNTLGLALLGQHDGEQALTVFEECLRQARALDDPARIGLVLSNLADVWVDRCDYARAAGLLEECLPYFRQVGAPTLVGYALLSLGYAHFGLGERDRAAKALCESLESMRASGARVGAADALELAGLLALARGQTPDAVCCFGAGAAVRTVDGAATTAEREQSVRRALEAARASVSAATFTDAWDRGAALRLEAALNLAVEVTEAWVALH